MKNPIFNKILIFFLGVLLIFKADSARREEDIPFDRIGDIIIAKSEAMDALYPNLLDVMSRIDPLLRKQLAKRNISSDLVVPTIDRAIMRSNGGSCLFDIICLILDSLGEKVEYTIFPHSLLLGIFRQTLQQIIDNDLRGSVAYSHLSNAYGDIRANCRAMGICLWRFKSEGNTY